jgi:MFS transporter, SP family, general alpha glucoside:H+ symporter
MIYSLTFQAPAYASEMLPMVLRVYFTSWTNMCFIIGQLIAAGILRACLEREDEWAFRIPFAIQWAWPVILVPVLCFAPESPWHLVRKGQHTQAEAVLRRLQQPETPIDPKQSLATIIYTNNLEEELSVGTSYRDCFKSFELRRTEIACICFAGQVICGSQFAYSGKWLLQMWSLNTDFGQATYFWEQVGLESDLIYNLNIVGTSIALVAATCSWLFLMPRFGRRTIYMSGVAGMVVTLFVIGILNTWVDRRSVGISQASLTIVWKLFFQLSVGQLGWAIPAEVGSTRLRQKTIVLARNSYYISQVIANVLQPYFMNPTAWNLRGYTGFVWGSTAFLILVWCFFRYVPPMSNPSAQGFYTLTTFLLPHSISDLTHRLPETKGRSFTELDVLFADKVAARKFKSTQVNAFDHEQNDVLKHLYAH